MSRIIKPTLEQAKSVRWQVRQLTNVVKKINVTREMLTREFD